MTGQEQYKNPFPAWMRRLDPNLELAGGNQLFLLLREKKGKGLGLLHVSMSIEFGFLGMALLGLLNVMPNLKPFSFNFLAGFFIMSTASAAIRWHSFGKRKTALRSIEQLIRLPQKSKDILTDLWTTRIKGADLVETLYLEQQQLALKGLPWIFAVFLSLCVVYLMMVGTTLPHILACLGVVSYLLSPLHMQLCGLGCFSLKSLADRMASAWSPTRGALSMSLQILVFLIPILPFCLVGGGLIFWAVKTQSAHALIGVIGLGISVVVLALGGILLRKRGEEQEKALRLANAAHEEMMRKQILEPR